MLNYGVLVHELLRTYFGTDNITYLTALWTDKISPYNQQVLLSFNQVLARVHELVKNRKIPFRM